MREALQRFMERVERLEVRLGEMHGRGPGPRGGEAREGEEREMQGLRRQVAELRSGLEEKDRKIRDLQQHAEELEGVVRRMKGPRPDGPGRREEPAKEETR